MGICNLRHVDAEIKKREKVVKRYIERLEGIEGIQLNPKQKDVNLIMHIFQWYLMKKLLVLQEMRCLTR